MNAKEEIILELKATIAHYENYKRHHSYDSQSADWLIELFTNLIAATESAIFDLPSDEEIQERALKYSTGCYVDYIAGCEFILNYKKSEL
jgi:hypothetical protein